MRLLQRSKPAAPRGPQVREDETDVNVEGKTPTPQPEPHEPELRDPGLRDHSNRDYKAILVRAGKEGLDDQITDLAAALAYYSFLAIPSILLVALGVFSIFADESAVQSLIDRVGTVAPGEVTALLDDSLTRMTENSSGGWAMAIIGALLAIWTTTGAMTSLMRALNRAYDRNETRGFVRQRVVAIAMVAIMLTAFALVF